MPNPNQEDNWSQRRLEEAYVLKQNQPSYWEWAAGVAAFFLRLIQPAP